VTKIKKTFLRFLHIYGLVYRTDWRRRNDKLQGSVATRLRSTIENTVKLVVVECSQRDVSCQLKSCQLPRNCAETTYTTSPDQIDGMKLEI